MTNQGKRFRPGGLRLLVVAVAGVLIGTGGAVALAANDGDDNGVGAAPTVETPVLEAADAAPAPRRLEATDPRQAVERFLTAEAEGDFASSFDYLSDTDRAAVGTVAGWEAAHASLLAPVLGHQIEQVVEEGSSTSVIALVEFEPSLDAVVGLVPDRARVTWEVVAAGDAWGVELAASAMEPLYPADTEAPAAVQVWAEARQRCASAPEWDGDLIGTPALADGLCRAQGQVAVGPTTPLGTLDATPFLSAFGGDAEGWIRVVPVTSPMALRAVVAPIGREWTVIGVLPGAG